MLAFPLGLPQNSGIGSTLQRIEIGAGQLLHFAEVACVKTKPRTKYLFLQI